MGPANRSFRTDHDEVIVLAPDSAPRAVAELAKHLAVVVASSQTETGPHISVAIGIASCPEHGDRADALLGSAEEAAWEAQAGGQAVMVARAGSLQDP